MKKIFILILLLCVCASVPDSFAEPAQKYIPVKGITHVNSNISSGRYPPERLVGMAREKGVGAIFVADNYAPQWEYGLYPFRGIIRKRVSTRGILRYGVGRYQSLVDDLNNKNKDITVLGSAEVTPFYYWTGHPFGKDLTLNDWDLQFLVFGLEGNEYKDIRNISNGGFAGVGMKSLVIVIPLAIITLGIMALKVKPPRYYLSDLLAWGMIAFGVIVFMYFYPFKVYRYDQYSGPAGPGPYQELIDYVHKKGGMTFWSAPEASIYGKKVDAILFSSQTAEDHMRETAGYTGFCVLYEGYKKIAFPGGFWDERLKEYCEGEQEEPVWAIGEMAYHDEAASGGKEIDDVQTVFFVENNTRTDILDAMRKGRMYAVRRGKDHILKLNDFYVVNEKGEKAYMGEEAEIMGDYTVRFNVGWEEGQPVEPVKAALVKDGEVVHIFNINSPGEYKFKGLPLDKGYYRLDVRGKYPSMLFSNPIFVRGKEK